MIKSVELNQRHNRDPIPTIKSLEIALTSKCNYHCPYCGTYKVNDMSYKTLSISALRTILDQCSDLERIKLSGGEVTLRFDDCVEICRYCTSRGIELQLNTNATLLNSERINLLQDAGLNIIHISLDFIDSVKYCNYYNVPKSMFYTIIRNISLCCQSFDCVVETILFSETIDHLSEICRFVYELGVRNYELQSGIKQDNWDQGISSKDDIMNALRKLFSQSKEDMNIYLTVYGFFWIHLSMWSLFSKEKALFSGHQYI